MVRMQAKTLVRYAGKSFRKGEVVPVRTRDDALVLHALGVAVYVPAPKPAARASETVAPEPKKRGRPRKTPVEASVPAPVESVEPEPVSEPAADLPNVAVDPTPTIDPFESRTYLRRDMEAESE